MGAAIAALLVVGLVGLPSGRGDTAPVADPLMVGTVLQRGLDDQEGPLMGAAGIGSVRLFIPWSEVESKPGLYDWKAADDVFGELARERLEPLPFLSATPVWAARLDGNQCGAADCAGYAPASAATRLAFARFAGAAVRRYGPDGAFWADHPGLAERPPTAWQIWNEPNLLSYFQPKVDPASYAELLRQAAAEIHSRDPGAEVIVAGLSGSRTTPKRISTQEFLTQFYAVPGIADSFEGLALHPYAGNAAGVFDQIETARQITAVSDPGVDLWITELGWASAGDRVWALVKTPKGQARILRRVFGRLIRRADEWNLRGAYWYAWRDTETRGAVCGWCWASGLRDAAGAAKPAYRALRRLTRP